MNRLLSRLVWSWGAAALALLPVIGCGSAIIAPTSLPTPLLHRGGEIEAAAQLGSNGIDVAAAGAVTDNVVATGLVSWDSRNDRGSASTRHLYVEAAAGYNIPFRGGSVITFLAGAGTGSSTEKRLSSTTAESAELTKTFLQILFGSGPIGSRRRTAESMLFEGGVAVRGSRIDVRNVRSGAAELSLPPVYFVEPRLFVRGLWGVFGCGMQFGLNLPIDMVHEISFSTVGAALTLSVHFSVAGNDLSAPLDP